MSDPKILALPATREMAEEMAESIQDIFRRNDPTRRTIAQGLADGSAVAREVVEAHALLLSDLGIDWVRDRWVRWGIEHDRNCPRCDNTGEYDADYDGDMPIIRECSHDRYLFDSKWNNRRDNPAALLAAILEVSNA